jgi:hypothetical protein
MYSAAANATSKCLDRHHPANVLLQKQRKRPLEAHL